MVAAHCIELTDDDLALVAETGVGVAHCPTSNMKLGNRAARIPELLAAGANVGLGTDSTMTNNNLDPFEEMRQAGLLARFSTGDPAVLPCAQLLELATIGGARALGLCDETGSIEPGKRADLAVVGLDRPHGLERETGSIGPGKRADLAVVRRDRLHTTPAGGADVYSELVYAHRADDVDTVVVDGRVVVADGRLLTGDESAIRAEAETQQAALLARTPEA